MVTHIFLWFAKYLQSTLGNYLLSGEKKTSPSNVAGNAPGALMQLDDEMDIVSNLTQDSFCYPCIKEKL